MLRRIMDLIHSQGTCVLAKEFADLTQNPRVSLLIGTRQEDDESARGNARAFMVNGMVQRTEDAARIHVIRGQFPKKHPHRAGLVKTTPRCGNILW